MFSMAVVNRFRAAATACGTAGRRTLRAGAKLRCHDMGLADLQRLKKGVVLRWKEHKQGGKLSLNFAKRSFTEMLVLRLFCEVGQSTSENMQKQSFY